MAPRIIIKNSGMEVPYEPPKIYHSVLKANKTTKEISTNGMNEILLAIDIYTKDVHKVTTKILKTIVAQKLKEYDYPKTADIYLKFDKHHKKG